ncbi:MAG: serine/threonine protein kinase [Deltaproteobacteria bacterium]|jgi:serine/threonine-protein kinase|nr:serine/threonine protein kinase [Deltaproteobacteria bacterium]MBW2532635.1 serine/threonine protein kinase [Deltaproteobacteria bacterium]
MTEPSSDSQWREGAVIGDRYRLRQLIGAGAMAEVWEAEHVTLETPVAVKLVSVAYDSRSDETLERFLREAKAAAQLRSPHVVQILDHGLQDHSAYIAMERLAGESLRTRLQRQGTLAPLEVARIVSELARGLDVAHGAGIVHRDLKPENIFLARDHGREVVKILDFGIAKRLDLQGADRLATQEGFMVGTPCYMSPEQVMGTQRVDARSDLWQVAVVVFECLCGYRPFDSEAIGELMMRICSGPIPIPSQVAAVPPGFDQWFAHAATRDVDGRFQSAAEMADALVALLAPHTTAAALADNLPARVPPALGSGAGTFDHSGVGTFDQSVGGLGTAARQSWSTVHGAAVEGRNRKLLLTALLVGLPVAALAATLLVVLLAGQGTPATATAPTTGLEHAEAATTSASAPVPAAPAPSAVPAPSARAAKADGGVDAGRGDTPPSQAPGYVPSRPTSPRPTPTRQQRPEDVLGI